MDNVCFHRSNRVKELCSGAGIKFLYVPPYLPDFYPNEEFFAELESHSKKAWAAYEVNPGQGF
jgi:transposase